MSYLHESNAAELARERQESAARDRLARSARGPEIIREATCRRCGTRIYLTRTGRSGYKWLASPRNIQSWHCGRIPEAPTRAHEPYPGIDDES